MKPQEKNKRATNSTEIFVRRQSCLGLSRFVRTLQSGWQHSLMIDQQTDCFGIAHASLIPLHVLAPESNFLVCLKRRTA